MNDVGEHIYVQTGSFISFEAVDCDERKGVHKWLIIFFAEDAESGSVIDFFNNCMEACIYRGECSTQRWRCRHIDGDYSFRQGGQWNNLDQLRRDGGGVEMLHSFTYERGAYIQNQLPVIDVNVGLERLQIGEDWRDAPDIRAEHEARFGGAAQPPVAPVAPPQPAAVAPPQPPRRRRAAAQPQMGRYERTKKTLFGSMFEFVVKAKLAEKDADGKPANECWSCMEQPDLPPRSWYLCENLHLLCLQCKKEWRDRRGNKHCGACRNETEYKFVISPTPSQQAEWDNEEDEDDDEEAEL